MYVVRSEITLPEAQQHEFLSQIEAAHAAIRGAGGFRWAMLLRSAGDRTRLAVVAMWLTRDQAGIADFPVQNYDVATARGAMTPATAVAIVDWQVEPAIAPSFVNQWNAAFHAIEDRLGSRLLQDLDTPGRYTGVHVSTSEINQSLLDSALNESGGEGLKPTAIERYEVLHLAEASG